MELQQVLIQGRTAGKRLMISGGVHGDEFEPLITARELIRFLRSKTEQIRGEVMIVPVVNEGAFENGSRVAPDGKDLARTCPGRPDGSETEQVAAVFSELIRQADYYIDLHTGGTAMSVYPLAGYGIHPNSSVHTGSREMAEAFGLPVVWGTSCELEGRSMSIARDAEIPAIYTEFLGGGQCSRAGVQSCLKGCLQVMQHLEMLDSDFAIPQFPSALENEVTLIIEDNRPESGHMQICHPAPQAGFFAPSVELGQFVETGDLLGTVSDVLGDKELSVNANQTGMVLVLRTFCRVEQNEALAVILEPRTESDRLKMLEISKRQPELTVPLRLNQLLD